MLSQLFALPSYPGPSISWLNHVCKLHCSCAHCPIRSPGDQVPSTNNSIGGRAGRSWSQGEGILSSLSLGKEEATQPRLCHRRRPCCFNLTLSPVSQASPALFSVFPPVLSLCFFLPPSTLSIYSAIHFISTLILNAFYILLISIVWGIPLGNISVVLSLGLIFPPCSLPLSLLLDFMPTTHQV